MENSFLTEFNKLNQSLNNTNTFLLDISLPIINYLRTKNDNFEQIMQQACWDNRRFASGVNNNERLGFGTLEHGPFDKTRDFLIYMSQAADDIGCTCHNKTWAEFHEEITPSLHEYCLGWLQAVSENKFHEKLTTVPFGFSDDYRAISKNLTESRIELEQAERAIACWQGAIPDIVMQESILQLRYECIKKLHEVT